MLPNLVDGRLPAGEWAGSWEEIEAAFATSQWRRHLLDGCRRALASLHVAGCDRDGRPKGIVVIDLKSEEFGP